mmetsp:Transcript_21637/g.47860  ORF Transcript_21637/g.47860 Transcript_21637/m.47860 type:complete len:533 (+) Transcript_21637:110-1708(+)
MQLPSQVPGHPLQQQQQQQQAPGSQKGKKAVARESNLAQKYQTPGQSTTVMIRNIPNEYTQDELIQEVTGIIGSPDVFDFFYLPWDSQTNGNVGYAFVNFHDSPNAQKAVKVFSNYRFQQHDSKKVGKVLPAHIQGLENNLRHLQDRAVVHGNHPCSPVVMWRGRKIELAKIFQELKMQDALRKFTSPVSAPTWQPEGRGSSEMASREGPGTGEGHRLSVPLSNNWSSSVANVGEDFANALDRAAGIDTSDKGLALRGYAFQNVNSQPPGMLGTPGRRGSGNSSLTFQNAMSAGPCFQGPMSVKSVADSLDFFEDESVAWGSNAASSMGKDPFAPPRSAPSGTSSYPVRHPPASAPLRHFSSAMTTGGFGPPLSTGGRPLQHVNEISNPWAEEEPVARSASFHAPSLSCGGVVGLTFPPPGLEPQRPNNQQAAKFHSGGDSMGTPKSLPTAAVSAVRQPPSNGPELIAPPGRGDAFRGASDHSPASETQEDRLPAQEARPEGGASPEDGVQEISIQDPHDDVMQKFLMKFGT